MSDIKAKLIRKIPAGKDRYGNQLPYYFDKYELECIDCGAHYFNKHYDRRTVPYCPNCRRIRENAIYKERKAAHEKNIINRVLDKITAEISEYKDDKIIHAESNEMIDIMIEIIANNKVGASRDVNT